jgi:hypothetical protein
MNSFSCWHYITAIKASRCCCCGEPGSKYASRSCFSIHSNLKYPMSSSISISISMSVSPHGPQLNPVHWFFWFTLPLALSEWFGISRIGFHKTRPNASKTLQIHFPQCKWPNVILDLPTAFSKSLRSSERIWILWWVFKVSIHRGWWLANLTWLFQRRELGNFLSTGHVYNSSSRLARQFGWYRYHWYQLNYNGIISMITGSHQLCCYHWDETRIIPLRPGKKGWNSRRDD